MNSVPAHFESAARIDSIHGGIRFTFTYFPDVPLEKAVLVMQGGRKGLIVNIHGNRSEGFRAFAVAQSRGLPVAALRRAWPVQDGEPTGPYWEMTFSRTAA